MKTSNDAPRCGNCRPRTRGLFGSLSSTHTIKLDREKTAHDYDRGQIIFYEGTPPLAIYCIHSGIVKLYKTGKNGTHIMIRILGPGDVIGYRALLANEPYAATAEAVDTTTACTITRDTINILLKNDPKLILQLLSKLATELRVSEDQMVTRLQEPVRQRTARFLMWLRESLWSGSRRSNTIVVPLLREEMAQMVGTTPETFSRTLRKFSHDGVIKYDRKSITITKPGVLQGIASA
ncbi:MAG: Crp/Fnr family transcriptional regulator [Candidatus Latescibacterota bacterium]|nr:MAG: Crp/Fnr family transcriptional regulator [Candidatus Latescibacterota bacterium]